MRVSASVSFENVEYDIHGQLMETLTHDDASGDVIGEIRILRLLAQGPTEEAARALLGKIFAEFCEIEMERGGFPRLLLTLVQRNFVVQTKRAGREHTAPQYLEIVQVAKTMPEQIMAEVDPSGSRVGDRELAGV